MDLQYAIGAMHGGRTPFDEEGALTGPARVLYAPTTVAAPADPYDVIPGVADASGEYPAETGWEDFGLAVDAPTYTHGRESEGLEYQQPSGALFQAITAVNRNMTVNVGHIDKKTLQVIENAAAAITVGASAGEGAGFDKLAVGLYSSAPQWRVALVSFRPTGSGTVIEPAPSPVGSRPPFAMRVIPRATITADDTEMSFERGTPTGAEVTFTAESEPTAPAGGEHGYWFLEKTGTIAAAA